MGVAMRKGAQNYVSMILMAQHINWHGAYISMAHVLAWHRYWHGHTLVQCKINHPAQFHIALPHNIGECSACNLLPSLTAMVIEALGILLLGKAVLLPVWFVL